MERSQQNKRIVYLSGLPRSGSTVLCNLLAAHPEVTSTPSSPLCNTIQSIRRTLSDEPFFLSQLDDNPEEMHNKAKRSTLAYMQSWLFDNEHSLFIDKNRGWLHMLESLRDLDPNFKMIVTLRDLRNVYASIERSHRQTLFIDFPDHSEHNIIDVRACQLFDGGGLIGSVIAAIENIKDIPNIVNHLYFWKYEDFLQNPDLQTKSVFEFLGIDPNSCEIDFNNIEQITKESDSYYRTKFPHKVHSSILKQKDLGDVSPRILDTILKKFSNFYEVYYPEAFIKEPIEQEPIERESWTTIEERVSKEIEEEIGSL